MQLQLKRLRWPEWVVGVGGLVLLASMVLLPWYKRSVDGWDGLRHAHWLVLLTVLLALALYLFQAGRRAPAIPVTLSVFAAIGGGLASVWLIYRVLISPPGGSSEVGAFVGLLSALAIVYGGYASMRMEGIAASDAPAEIPTVRLVSGAS
jgi:uncharacterized membrane protein